MRVLIFGAKGQDARILSNLYAEKNSIVYLVSRTSSPGAYTTDYTVDSLRKILRDTKPDVIYLTAAQSSVSRSFSDNGQTLLVNTQIATNFLEAFIKSGLRSKVAWFNSSEIYGELTNDRPHNEESKHNPQSPYALSKSISSQLFSYYASLYNINYIEAVLFNHESNYRRGDYFVLKAVRELYRVRKGEISKVYFGDLSVSRDFGGAINYMNILMELMSQDFTGKINICSGSSVKLREIVEYICKYFALEFEEVVFTDEKLIRFNEPKLIIGDNSKLQGVLKVNKVETDFFVVLKEIIDEYVYSN